MEVGSSGLGIPPSKVASIGVSAFKAAAIAGYDAHKILRNKESKLNDFEGLEQPAAATIGFCLFGLLVYLLGVVCAYWAPSFPQTLEIERVWIAFYGRSLVTLLLAAYSSVRDHLFHYDGQSFQSS
jgi:hypothetical protein